MYTFVEESVLLVEAKSLATKNPCTIRKTESTKVVSRKVAFSETND